MCAPTWPQSTSSKICEVRPTFWEKHWGPCASLQSLTSRSRSRSRSRSLSCGMDFWSQKKHQMHSNASGIIRYLSGVFICPLQIQGVQKPKPSPRTDHTSGISPLLLFVHFINQGPADAFDFWLTQFRCMGSTVDHRKTSCQNVVFNAIVSVTDFIKFSSVCKQPSLCFLDSRCNLLVCDNITS